MASSAPGASAALVPSVPSAIGSTPEIEYTVEPPRCTPEERSCLPEPDDGTYRARAKRYPMDEAVRDDAQGSCEHDGDCLLAGCGHQCISRFRVPPPHPCLPVGRKRDNPTFCGCVEKRCQWFAQQLRRRVKSTVSEVAVHVQGKAITDADVLSSAAELLDFDLSHCYERSPSLLPAQHRLAMTLDRLGVVETSVSGVPTLPQKCARDELATAAKRPHRVPDIFVQYKEVQVSAVIKVQMVWAP